MPQLLNVRAVVLTLVAGTLAPASALAQYSLEALPTVVGQEPGFGSGWAIARGISGNGQVIVGSTGTLQDERAVVWRRESGTWTRSFLPMLDGEVDARAAGRALTTSHDGSVIVGMTGRFSNTSTTSNPGVPAIWRTGSTGTTLQTPVGGYASGLRGSVTGVSADGGSMALWTRSTVDTTRGARLARLDDGALTYLSPDVPNNAGVLSATLPGSSNMSSDGGVIVGMRQTGGNEDVGFSLTNAGGFADLPNTISSFRFAKVGAVSGDGRVVGGTLANQAVVNNVGIGVVWRDGVRQMLQGANGFAGVSSMTVSGLASNGWYGVGVGGTGVDLLNNFLSPVSISSGVVAVLLEGNRVFNLKSVLVSNGVAIPSTTNLHYANAITPDGRTITGVGSRLIGTTNQREFFSFVATIPSPGSASLLAMAGIVACRRRRG